MYRPEIKVLDCTIRDGGLMNDWYFDDDLVSDVWTASCEAGLDYVELGYRANPELFSKSENGPWRYCEEADVRRVTNDGDTGGSNTKISIMCDVGRVEEEQFIPASESVISMVRVACYVKDVDKAIHLVNFCEGLGYETTINIMAVSHALELDVDEAVQQIDSETTTDAVYVVDSFGAMYSEQIHHLVDKYRGFLSPDKEVGIHCHNNQQLGFGNTIEAIIHNANFLDASIFGIGRGAGNCPMELLVSFLKNPKFDVRPILDVCARRIAPLQKELAWGYHIPYMVTGTHNRHPRTAMAIMGTDKESDYCAFYDLIAAEEELD
ncbi:MAG TPA: aldolase catalytic domain-containing protein [Armatimonadota bacterium]|nr:aldolase catalytic domain-containing protein [Armatimonadota bacterium]